MPFHVTSATLAPVFAAGLALVTLTGAVGAQDQPKDMLELTLATAETDINPTTDSVLKLAARLGLYEKHGVKVNIIELDGTPQAVAALNSGSAALADIGIDSAIRLRADNDLKLRGIGSGALGAPYLIAAKTAVATLGDLAGHSFAIADNGSLDHTLTQVVLAAKGVPADAPQYVAIGAPGVRAQALAAGKVDATTVSYGTFQPIADTPGIHILVTPEDFAAASPNLTKFIAALDTTIDKKHEALQRFVDALIDASRTFESHPDQWVDAVHAVRDDLTTDSLTRTAGFFGDRWCVNGCLLASEVEKTVKFVYSKPDFKDVKPVDPADLVDQDFVTQAISDLGAYSGPSLDKR